MKVRVLARIAAPLCIAISLGACASQDKEWASPQTGIKATQADIARCESIARNESWRSGQVDTFTNARFAGVTDPRMYNEPLHRGTSDPQVQEIRMRDICMEKKGYQSVAVVNGEPQWGPDQLIAGKTNDHPQLVGVQDDKAAPQ